MRQTSPQPGMILKTTVRTSPNGLVLKDPWVCYTATLEDFGTLAWKDKIRVRVIEVDHDRETMLVEYVSHIESEDH